MSTVGIALVGCAHIHTPNFIGRINARKNLRTLAVWDTDNARAKKCAEELHAPVVASLEAIFNDRAITALVICSETHRHEELVIPAAAARKHLFVEKPLGIGARDAGRMADAIERAGVVFQTGYFMRGQGCYRFLREQIAAGAFGAITRVRVAQCHPGALQGWFDTEWRWMADPRLAGFGAFGDLGTHALDVLMWCLGDITEVTAATTPGTRRYGDCDEAGEALLRFRNGALGSIGAGWIDAYNDVRFVISGMEGYAHITGDNLFVCSPHIAGADGTTPWTDVPATLPHAFDMFLDAISGTPGLPLVSAREAAQRCAVMEAIYAAQRARAWISIDAPAAT